MAPPHRPRPNRPPVSESASIRTNPVSQQGPPARRCPATPNHASRSRRFSNRSRAPVRRLQRWTLTLLTLAVLTAGGSLFAIHRSVVRERRLAEMKTQFVSSVSHELRAPLGSIRITAEWLQQALVNLLDNALKFSPEGGTVTVAANSMPQAIRIRITDHGPGIPEKDRRAIFERFHRLGNELRRETQGAGIGLSIVKPITEAHHGAITVESASPRGSTFTLTLPPPLTLPMIPDHCPAIFHLPSSIFFLPSSPHEAPDPPRRQPAPHLLLRCPRGNHRRHRRLGPPALRLHRAQGSPPCHWRQAGHPRAD